MNQETKKEVRKTCTLAGIEFPMPLTRAEYTSKYQWAGVAIILGSEVIDVNFSELGRYPIYELLDKRLVQASVSGAEQQLLAMESALEQAISEGVNNV